MSSLRAFALPGELDAVERHCGPPLHESRETSQVTNHMQRTLFYPNDVLLHFEPEEGGWGFTTGWHGHLPIGRDELERRLPCFRNAMNEVWAATRSDGRAIDPTIADQSKDVEAPAPSNPLGPYLPLIAIAVVVLVLLIAVPSARERRRKKMAERNVEALEDRPYRTPEVETVVPPANRKHIDPDL